MFIYLLNCILFNTVNSLCWMKFHRGAVLLDDASHDAPKYYITKDDSHSRYPGDHYVAIWRKSTFL